MCGFKDVERSGVCRINTQSSFLTTYINALFLLFQLSHKQLSFRPSIYFLQNVLRRKIYTRDLKENISCFILIFVMPRMPRSLCAECREGIDNSNIRPVTNVSFRLFVLTRTSKHLQPNDTVCLTSYKKFKSWFRKAKSLYDHLIDTDSLTRSEGSSENGDLFRS